MPELYIDPLFSDANLVGYWRMEGNFNDSKGSNNPTPTDISYGLPNGKYGQGSIFNGSSSKAIKTSPSGLPTGNLTATIATWFYPTAAQSASVPGLCVFGKEAANQLAGLGLKSDTLYWLGYSNDATVSYSHPTNEWVHLGATINNKTVKFYVNGIQQGTNQTLINTPNVVNDALSFGIQRPGALVYAQGYLDDTCIFSRDLSAAEMLRLATPVPGGGFPIFFDNTAIA